MITDLQQHLVLLVSNGRREHRAYLPARCRADRRGHRHGTVCSHHQLGVWRGRQLRGQSDGAEHEI